MNVATMAFAAKRAFTTGVLQLNTLLKDNEYNYSVSYIVSDEVQGFDFDANGVKVEWLVTCDDNKQYVLRATVCEDYITDVRFYSANEEV